MTRRVLAGVLAFGLTGLVGAVSAPAQQFGFRSLGAAERAAERIMDASGLRAADFEIVVEPGSDNAAAGIASPCGRLSGCRVIVYDPEFLLDIERRADEWGPISIMAHEVAHHLLGHTVFAEGSRPPNELDADFFSGFILQKLGASLESAQAAMRLIASPNGSSSHPPRRERLEYIAMGWRKAATDARAGGAGSARAALEGAREELEEMRAALRRVEGRLRESETRANEAEAQVNEAEARVNEAQAERDVAEEELRDLRTRGEAAEAEVRVAEARVREAEAEVHAAEGRIREAQAERDTAAQELAQARDANERFGEQAEAAAETADRAFVMAALLVPLVLVALVLALRKPRLVRSGLGRASQLIHGLRRRSDGSIDPDPSPSHDPAPRPSPGPPPTPTPPGPPVIPVRHPAPAPRPAAPPWFAAAPPAPPFDGAGLERCAEPGGFVLGRDGALVDAVVDHQSVSRRHVRLTRLDGRLRVEDLNSTNGTRVNGRRLEPFAPCVLAPGDAVVVGDVHLALAV